MSSIMVEVFQQLVPSRPMLVIVVLTVALISSDLDRPRSRLLKT